MVLCLPSPWQRFGKKLDELLAQGNIFSSVSNPAPVPPRVAEHFDAFASRETTKKKVIQALMDDTTNLIGIYGIGGIGKATLMKEIRKQVEETKLFDKIVFATVSQNPDLRGIQTRISESMDIKIKEQSIPARAAILSAKLKQEKSILLMLDDLWKRLELNDVGIILSEAGENICKVLITSRKLDVSDSMNTTENIKSNLVESDPVVIVEGLNATDPAQVLVPYVGGPPVNPQPLNTRTRLDQLEEKMQALSRIIDQVTILEERLDGFSDDQAHMGERLVTLEGVVEGNMATLLDQVAELFSKNEGYQARSGGDQGHGQSRSGGVSTGGASGSNSRREYHRPRNNGGASSSSRFQGHPGNLKYFLCGGK
ncbi:hypothetical protein GIB67_013102 [Kingdonia uniflora]|uniref:NB-ARC domain-containing protein n=1 Tax=Kingdonia uniflora TaxID=39325 RepID=A0A7J7NNV9_9MAGN|nr:hypothetical protein GIB67_013102 [Kingdonia uniflora]